MYFSIQQVYALLCFIFVCVTTMAQPESLFHNYDGKLKDEINLARSENIKSINIQYSLNDVSCMNSEITFDNEGKIISRKNYSCIEGTRHLVYHETYKYNSEDSVIHEHYVSMHSGITYEHIKDHSYKKRKDTIIKTTVVRDSSRTWDSIVTKYSLDGQVYMSSKNNPIKTTESKKKRIEEVYVYDDQLLRSIKSEMLSDHSVDYKYDSENRLISKHAVTASGVVNDQTTYTYDELGNISSYSQTFPDGMRTDFDFDENNLLVEMRYFEFDDDANEMKLVSTNTYFYNDAGLIDHVHVKLSKYTYTTVATIFYEFNP